MKFKHNKKKNSAFLYEVLILELAKTINKKDFNKRKAILETLKTYFSKNTLIGKELKIYKSIASTKNVDNLISEKILNEAKREYFLLDKEKLVNEQNKLTLKIKEVLGAEAFSNFVPNYKDLASISQIFNKELSIKTRVLLENDLVQKMSSDIVNEVKMVPVDNLIINNFVKKFNEQYSSLHEEQKKLLNKFITSFSDNGLELKVFLNEEIGRLKKELVNSLSIKEFVDDSNMSLNGKKVLSLLESFSNQNITESMVLQIIKVQNLIREIKS